ncbi:hypothetical protein [Ruegeria sp. Ofav3-42]|uniref:hypothetical protein n=1 Tax=Ruegeria sp. Ofav3-42 TaxID=2917759 RepID=UPI001EF3FDF9|nr:hypothetical protein [Ruegeria sp. Ofav3-42]MCG7520842.1 hypothetical protein [Ruegeria sp. Ofav3-42]
MTTITQLPNADTLTGKELLEVSQASATVTMTAGTISAAAADNSFNDSGSGFVTAGFVSGDRVVVSGFGGNAANNIAVAEITALTAGKMTIGGSDGDVIVDEAAGDSVTISKWESRKALANTLGGGGGGGGSGTGTPEKLGYADFTPPTEGRLTAVNEQSVDFNGYDNGVHRITITGNEHKARAGETVSGDFDKVYVIKTNQPNEGFNSIGLYVRDTSNNQMSSFVIRFDNNLYKILWNDWTFESSVTLKGESARGLISRRGAWTYYRLERVGSALKFYLSDDGLYWLLMHTTTVTDGGISDIDEVGVIVDTNSVESDSVTTARVIGVNNGVQPEKTVGGSSALSRSVESGSFNVSNAMLSGNVYKDVDSTSGAVSVTVPAGLTGTEPLLLENIGTNDVQLVAASGVTINSFGGNLKLAGQFASGTLVPKGSDTYSLVGDLKA